MEKNAARPPFKRRHPEQTPSRRRRALIACLLAVIPALSLLILLGATPFIAARQAQPIARASRPLEHRMHTLPPPFTPLLTALIGDQRLSASLFRSYARLYAAAWPYAYQCTGPLDFEEQVVGLLGIGRSQARQHLRRLRQIGLLNWSSDGSRRYIFRFALPQLSIYPGPDAQPVRASLPASGQGPNAAGPPPTHTPPAKVSDEAGVTGKSPGSESRKPEYGGVEVNLFYNNQMGYPQHQTDSAKPSGNNAVCLPAAQEADYQLAFQFLRRAGVWSKIAERLAQQIVANQRSGEAGLPGLGDILGWTAYCFASQTDNQISNPAAVLAANLTNNRPCPQDYRPPLVCSRCHYVEARCRCKPGKGEYGYPSEFLTAALKPGKKYAAYTDRWGVCLYCSAIPCQCVEGQPD